MKHLLTVCLFLAGLSAFSQNPEMIATTYKILDSTHQDVTAMTFKIKDTKKGFRITTDYACIYKKLVEKYDDRVLAIHVEYKEDRGGKFHRYTVYLTNGKKEEITEYLKTLN